MRLGGVSGCVVPFRDEGLRPIQEGVEGRRGVWDVISVVWVRGGGGCFGSLSLVLTFAFTPPFRGYAHWEGGDCEGGWSLGVHLGWSRGGDFDWVCFGAEGV